MTATQQTAARIADHMLAQAADLLKNAADTLAPYRDQPDIYQAWVLIPHSPLRLARTWLPTNGHHTVGAGLVPAQENKEI